jgi:hypothetical protein
MNLDPQINILSPQHWCANDRLRNKNESTQNKGVYRCVNQLRNKSIWQQGCAC